MGEGGKLTLVLNNLIADFSFIYNILNVFFFFFLCIYKTGNLDIIIKKSSFIFLRYDFFSPSLVCMLLYFFISHDE